MLPNLTSVFLNRPHTQLVIENMISPLDGERTVRLILWDTRYPKILVESIEDHTSFEEAIADFDNECLELAKKWGDPAICRCGHPTKAHADTNGQSHPRDGTGGWCSCPKE